MPRLGGTPEPALAPAGSGVLGTRLKERAVSAKKNKEWWVHFRLRA